MDGKGKERIRYDVTNVEGEKSGKDGATERPLFRRVSIPFNTIQYCS